MPTRSSRTAATSSTAIIRVVCCARTIHSANASLSMSLAEVRAELGADGAADRGPHEPDLLVLGPQALDQVVERDLAHAVRRQAPTRLVLHGRRAEQHHADARLEVRHGRPRDERGSHHVGLEHLAPLRRALIRRAGRAARPLRCAPPRRGRRAARPLRRARASPSPRRTRPSRRRRRLRARA